jgi:tRNA A37 threonylcarbamoyladenosine dehydratase
MQKALSMQVTMPDLTPLIDIEESGLTGSDRRFSGLSRLYGVNGASRIGNAHVAVVGLGGVGSWAAEALARSGVKRLTLIDLDHVSESNINRQIHAVDASLGQSKVLAMQERIGSFSPACDVTCIEGFVEPGNWPSLLPEGVDAVIDACDQVRAKTAMASWARERSTLFISVGAAGGKRHAHLVDIDDLSRATHDPLLAQVRQQLRRNHDAPREGKNLGIACVFSKEAVRAPDASCSVESDGTLNCHGYGSVVTVTATFGQCAAGWVLDQIAGDSRNV